MKFLLLVIAVAISTCQAWNYQMVIQPTAAVTCATVSTCVVSFTDTEDINPGNIYYIIPEYGSNLNGLIPYPCMSSFTNIYNCQFYNPTSGSITVSATALFRIMRIQLL